MVVFVSVIYHQSISFPIQVAREGVDIVKGSDEIPANWYLLGGSLNVQKPVVYSVKAPLSSKARV
ncbi:hypothetical protein GCM10025791_43440 [Halioxenophilus aromaticivorans]|uniref:Uncharacterized protein n=1 Tax=Halioxenophilus aromaticivorans TaxID=1306992 RepID=A0AAV3U977_9ALTE